jgi:hypothetical protein
MTDLQIQTVTYGAFLSLLMDDVIEAHEADNPEIVDATAAELDLIEAICIAAPVTKVAFFHCAAELCPA